MVDIEDYEHFSIMVGTKLLISRFWIACLHLVSNFETIATGDQKVKHQTTTYSNKQNIFVDSSHFTASSQFSTESSISSLFTPNNIIRSSTHLQDCCAAWHIHPSSTPNSLMHVFICRFLTLQFSVQCLVKRVGQYHKTVRRSGRRTNFLQPLSSHTHR